MSDLSGRLESIEVRGLFGVRDHFIDLDAERPTVITGLNGSGKSTILRMVKAVARAELETLARFPFEFLQLTFTGIAPFSVTKSIAGAIEFKWDGHVHVLDKSQIASLEDLPDWAQQALRDNSDGIREWTQLVDYSPPGWSPAELREVHEAIMLVAERRRSMESPDWMIEFRSQFQVLFVSDQRLIAEGGQPRRITRRVAQPRAVRSGTRAIGAASSDIAARIQQADSSYARASQESDRTFPGRLIAAMKKSERVSTARLSGLVNEVELKRENLRQVGLLDRPGNSYDPSVADEDLEDPNVRSVMAALMQTNLDKLDILGDLGDRLTSFKDFLDKRYTPKKVSLSRREGIRIELSNGASISVVELSSGEQQMAVLAYEILFRAKEGTLVVIDEPEISLHVLWQDTLIDDLMAMGAASGLQFLMATHSPIIIASHRELERSLDLLDEPEE